MSEMDVKSAGRRPEILLPDVSVVELARPYRADETIRAAPTVLRRFSLPVGLPIAGSGTEAW